MLRVLVVSPEYPTLPKLAQASELTRLGDVAGVDTETIIGPLVTADRIQQRLRRARFDVVLWSGHGAGGRLLLPGGAEVEPRWLASEVKRAGAWLVILAVCDSAQRRGLEGFTDVLPAAGVNLVAMIIDVSDKSAIAYDVALLHSLANGDNLREAHRIGIEAIHDRPDAIAPQLFPADRIAADLGSQVERLQTAMANGRNDDALDIIQECATTLRTLEKQLDGHERRIKAIERRQRPPWQVRFWQSLALAVVALTAILFAVFETRAMFFPTVQAGVLLTFMTLALAGASWHMADVTLERIK